MEHTIELEATLRAPLDEVCDAFVRRSTQGVEPTRLEVELSTGGSVRQQVDVHFGPLQVEEGSATQSIHIEAADHPYLFPTLDGELIALGMQPEDETRICLTGRYRPPLGVAGAIGDRLGGQHLAEGSVEAFFADFVANITHELETTHLGWKPAPATWTLRD